MWCPSVSLSVWSNAWLAGQAAPDDVLDALSAWAPTHSVTARDSVAAGRAGLPWPDVDAAGAMSLLQTVRVAAGRSAQAPWPDRPAIIPVLPVPGDVRGLNADTPFQRDALVVGEAVVVTAPDGGAIGLVPGFCDAEDEPPSWTNLAWSVYALPAAPGQDIIELGEAEYALRTAVRAAAEALAGLHLGGDDGADPRAMVEEVLEAGRHHRMPDHAPPRAVRVLATAAHVDAIIAVTSGVTPIAPQNATQARIADDALRPLAGVVRSARAAAVSAILHSAWR